MADPLTDDLARLAPRVDGPAAAATFRSTARRRRHRRRGLAGGGLAVALLGAATLVVTTGSDRDTDAVVAGPEEDSAPLPVGDPAFEVLLEIPSRQPPATLAAASDDASLAELWSDLAGATPSALDVAAGPPAIDLDRRVVVSVAIDLQDVLCGTTEITAMARSGAVVTPRFEQTQRGVCANPVGDESSVVYVIALDRQAVQPGYTLTLTDLAEPTAPPLATLDVTVPPVESTAVRFRTVASYLPGTRGDFPSIVPSDASGSVVAAVRPDQLAALRASLADPGPRGDGSAVPDAPRDELALVDLDREVVVAFTVASGGCPPFVDGLGDDPDALTPRYVPIPGLICTLNAFPFTYILAVERASVPDGFTLELTADEQFPVRSLRVEVGAAAEETPPAEPPQEAAAPTVDVEAELLVVVPSDTPAGTLAAAVDDVELAELWPAVATAGIDGLGLGGIAAGSPPPPVDLSRRIVLTFTTESACEAVVGVHLVADGAALVPELQIDPSPDFACIPERPPSLTYVITVDRDAVTPGFTLAAPPGSSGARLDVSVPSSGYDGVRFRTVLAPFSAFDDRPSAVPADPTGSLRTAATPEELTELLRSLGLGDQVTLEGEAVTSGLPIPSIDPDTEVVVAFVVNVACATFLAGLDGDAGEGGVLVPRLADVPGKACRSAL
jgi:hypothetical protein